MYEFKKFVYTPPRLADALIAVAACRAGGIGVYNAELEIDPGIVHSQLDFIALHVNGEYGVKLDASSIDVLPDLRKFAKKGLRWLILDCELVDSSLDILAKLRHEGVRVLAEMISSQWPLVPLEKQLDGLVVKGNEAGGFVGEYSSFILLQRWLKQTELPLYMQGGVTPDVAAACSALGVSGCVLDSQVLLLDESPLSLSLRPFLENLTGNETIAVGNAQQGRYFRLLVRPGLSGALEFAAGGESCKAETLKTLVRDKINWNLPKLGLLPVGQDVCFAQPWRKRYGCLAAVFSAIDAAITGNLRLAVAAKPLTLEAPLAQALGIALPIVQGPMARTSDNAQFAKAVADGGALPMLAFALQKSDALKPLLSETRNVLQGRSWGIGLLGFAPQALLDDQIAVAKVYHPAYAIIAGGRPDQAVSLEAAGIPAFLHIPSANLLQLFLEEGARRFIFEGRECGGHIGPLSSFVLWGSMIDRLLLELEDGKLVGADLQILFAGGIHDAVSSAMVQVLAAPLLAKGVKIGILMGSSYLYTREIVESGAIVQAFQQQALDCEQTVNLDSGSGHASRCAYTNFVKTFFDLREQMRHQKIHVDLCRKALDQLVMGRLRVATKGLSRVGDKGKLKKIGEDAQRHQGIYMLGQLAILRSKVSDIRTLHREVTEDAAALLITRLGEAAQPDIAQGKPLDIAVIGISSVLPKANSAREYWENILNKVDAITEIPLHRWDWRLYFDENRNAQDKIYSKWGGFLDDMVFDPTRYGMPPKSMESVDPIQLMALEVARQTLADAGYEHRVFNRERASVIIGASGGAADVGTQYGLRSEWVRFQGWLPDDVASRLPEWTEDTFAGILPNVIAGRIANRLNFGGVNFSTDAACASSLAALYQGVAELAAGRSDLVIAGGVDTNQGPSSYMGFSKTHALSPQGRCSTFDEGADGIVISEGIAMVALKRLVDAERDGDRIYAVIKGVGGSSDGKAKGLTAPLPAGQLRAMRRAYCQAGFGPDTVGLFEAHGTGTVAGDTAELESTTRLIKEAGGSARQAVIGSVKTLIGHCKATAGAAGLLKAVLALHHRVLPPHHGVNRPIAALREADCPLYLIDEATPWLAAADGLRRAAVSAFGFGGTNFHVVLEEYAREYRPWLCSSLGQCWPVELYLWHAADRKKLIVQLSHIQQELGTIKNIELRDLAYSLSKDWQPGREVLAIVAVNLEDLLLKLTLAQKYLQGAATLLPAGIYHGCTGEAAGKIAVLFSGQGSQYTGMLRELARYFPVCGETLSEADRHLSKACNKRFGAGMRLSHFIFTRGCYSEQAQAQATKDLMSLAQPALGAVESALWNLMRTLGLAPDMLGGHSYGEFVALHASGMFDFQTLMLLSEARGRFVDDAAAGQEAGAMAAVIARREVVAQAINDIEDVIVANHNAPLQSVISGTQAALEQAMEILARQGVDASLIPVAAAFHSRFMAPAKARLAGLIADTDWKSGAIPVYSNSSGKPHCAQTNRIKDAMADHLVRPVEFVTEIEAMYSDGARVFLELGPKNVLARLIARILDGRPHKTVALDDNGGGMAGLLHALGQLLCNGVKLDVLKLYEGRQCAGGDTANLASMQRAIPVSKNAWLLNGSAVRRVSEPARQVGVLVGQPGTAHSAFQIAKPLLNSTSLADSQPKTEKSPVMAEYFATMRLFLETQERVLTAYNSASARSITLRQPPASMPLSAPEAPSASTLPELAVFESALAGVITRDGMAAILLGIVEIKTGYPQDMIDLDQNLEADLGIDSIKRIEIVGALLRGLPDSYRQALAEKRALLNTKGTLNGMLDLLFSPQVNEAAHPDADVPLRHIIWPKPEPWDRLASRHLKQGHYLVTQDSRGLWSGLADALRRRGCTVSLIPRGMLAHEISLTGWCDASLAEIGEIAGIVHLAQLGSDWLSANSCLAEWRVQLQLNEKSLFTLLHKIGVKLADDAHILSASTLGGYFGRKGCEASGMTLQGGAVGLLKSLHQERKGLRVKAVDLDSRQENDAMIAVLMTELEVQGGRQEVGYPGGIRTIFQTVAQAADILEAPRNLVVLATGGARGVTAEALRALAMPGNTLLLTGRTSLQEHEPEESRSYLTPEGLRAYLLAKLRNVALKLRPAQIQSELQAILAQREMRSNIEDFRNRGAIVAYYAVDVTHEAEMRQLFENIHQQYGDIGGVVHGAGIIEDRLLKDKTGESWSRVVETKVLGALLLQKYVQPGSLRFFTVFSSVAGRYGNSGQCDYATANELMNRLCCQLNTLWSNRVKVTAYCWGPWGKVQFGAGMVSPETEIKFAKMKIMLVKAGEGRSLFLNELQSGNHSPVEIVCGAGPWEQQEAELGQMDKA